MRCPLTNLPIIKTTDELREWMMSLNPAHQITDEVLGWVSCQYHAKNILDLFTQKDLANELAKGIPSVNNIESLQDALNYDSGDESEQLVHSLGIQEVAARMLGKYEVAKLICEKIDELTWYDDH